jgi:acetyl esterase
VAIGGESSGGNLATVAALKRRQDGNPALTLQLLVYPLVDFGDDSPSMREFASGHFITSEMLAFFERHYLGIHGPSSSGRVATARRPARLAAGVCHDRRMRPASRPGGSLTRVRSVAPALP